LRPERLVLVTGTATGVGKTWVTTRLAAAWREAGATVAARKPVQSFDAGADGPTDAEVLAEATGERPSDVCPLHRWYPLAMAPPMAAERLGRSPSSLADLMAEVAWPTDPPVRYGLVEGAGGPRSPLASDGDTVSLAGALQPDHVVLVADAGLGAVNAVLLSAAALAPWRPIVLLNHYDAADPVHAANAAWLRGPADLHVLTAIPELVAHLSASCLQNPYPSTDFASEMP